MANNIISVDQLLEDIRSQIDEDNLETISDRDILTQINRAQKHAFGILARHYPDPILTYKSVDLTSGVAEYSIPEGAFEGRIMRVEIETDSGYFQELRRASFKDVTYYESPNTLNVPYYYIVVGPNYRMVPAPTGTFDARVWYIEKPEKLVKSQGRITQDPTSSSVVLDAIGEDLTSEVDSLKSYVNIVDAQTGLVKISLQVQNIDTDENIVTFKNTPSRTSVQNKTIETDILSPSSGLSIEPDDIVCIGGTAIPLLQDPFVNFYHEFATNALLRKLGESTMMDKQMADEFEQEVERQWAGRENTMRVQKRNRAWNAKARWYYPRQGGGN